MRIHGSPAAEMHAALEDDAAGHPANCVAGYAVGYRHRFARTQRWGVAIDESLARRVSANIEWVVTELAVLTIECEVRDIWMYEREDAV